MAKVLVEIDQSVVILTLNDPGRLNAVDPQMSSEIREAIRFAADPAHKFRCLVLTGAGRGFCSGGSVNWMEARRTGQNEEPEYSEKISLATHHHSVLMQLRALPFPVITAVNGPAAGIGFSYALTGDMIVAAKSAFFLTSFRNIGVSPDGGMSWTLPRIIGWARAKELLLMGNRLPADRALEWGMINRVYADETFMAETLKLAHELANGPTIALAQIRRLAWESWENSYAQQLDLEERVQPSTFATEDAIEGARAILEKRQTVFQGK